MKFTAEKFKLKDGRVCQVREIEVKDAAQMVEYLKTIMGESYFLNSYPEEITMTADEEAKMIKGFIESEGTLMLVVEIDGRLIANGTVTRFRRKKMRHRGNVAVAVLKEFWNLGIGKKFLYVLKDMQRDWGFPNWSWIITPAMKGVGFSMISLDTSWWEKLLMPSF